jgi:hypothetical protein
MSWLVPDDVDDCMTSSPFLFLALATLGPGLSTETAVREYVQELGLRSVVQELSRAVSAAGVRARDSGLLRSEFDDNLKVFAPEEIWLFNLAFDVIAMLGCIDGLSDRSLAQFKSNLRSLDDEATSHTWKKQLKKAGDGPGQFRELRARIPHHTPHPSRY